MRALTWASVCLTCMTIWLTLSIELDTPPCIWAAVDLAQCSPVQRDRRCIGFQSWLGGLLPTQALLQQVSLGGNNTFQHCLSMLAMYQLDSGVSWEPPILELDWVVIWEETWHEVGLNIWLDVLAPGLNVMLNPIPLNVPIAWELLKLRKANLIRHWIRHIHIEFLWHLLWPHPWNEASCYYQMRQDPLLLQDWRLWWYFTCLEYSLAWFGETW